jgi:hypothetical protein
MDKFLNNGLPLIPRIKVPIVDVQTTARAHLMGAKVSEAANQRFILVNETIWFVDVA